MFTLSVYYTITPGRFSILQVYVDISAMSPNVMDWHTYLESRKTVGSASTTYIFKRMSTTR